MQEKRIAVIMSVYKNDVLEFVRPSVESILNQTYDDFDFFIQYDGPVRTDVDGYLSALEDGRVRIYRRDENKGLARSLNDLLAIVLPMGYQYIARMDADDISELNRFERQIAYYDCHPQLECLGTWAVEITGDGDEYFKKKMPESHDGCLEQFRKRDPMIHPTVMFRRSYLEKAGLYDLDTFFGEDTMMWAQGFASGCKMGNVPEYLYRFRLDDNFFNRRRGWKYARGIWQLRRRVNKMLGFGIVEDMWAVAYAVAKMMPESVLSIIYKNSRKVKE